MRIMDDLVEAASVSLLYCHILGLINAISAIPRKKKASEVERAGGIN